MRDTSLAARIRHPHLEEARSRTPSAGEGAGPPLEREVSSGTEELFEDARESVSPRGTSTRLAPVKSGSPTRDSRFVEMMD